MEKVIVFLADSLSRKFGGINVVNYELCIALSRSDTCYNKIVCISLDEEIQISENENLIHFILGENEGRRKFVNADKHEIISILTDHKYEPICFIGHNTKSGQIANTTTAFYNKNNNKKVKSCVFHHMNYAAYESFKDKAKRDPELKANKLNLQKEILKNADLIFAVGPKLYQSAVSKTDNADKVVMFIPGIPEIEGKKNQNKTFSMITFGRFDQGVETIKQYKVPFASFAKLQVENNLGNDAGIYIIGINDIKQTDELMEFVKLNSDNRPIPLNAAPYYEEKEKIFEELKDHNVSIMPSIHEGFGLTGWESIAAEVPLIITENSGLAEFLKELNFDTSGIISVKIEGKIKKTKTGGYELEGDVKEIYNALKIIKEKQSHFKNKIKLLKNFLVQEYNWEKCTERFINHLNQHGIKCSELSDVIEEDKYKYAPFLAKSFIDNGDFVSSKNIYLDGGTFENSSFNKQFNIILIEQKYGQLESALKNYDIASSQKTLTNHDKALFELLEFKIRSQLNQHKWIEKNYKKVRDQLLDVNEVKRCFSVYNRSAISLRIIGKENEAIDCINNAEKFAVNGVHTLATSQMYKVLLSCFLEMEDLIRSPVEKIQESQQLYFSSRTKNKNLNLWQTHNFKSIVQCLYVESAINYKKSSKNPNWKIKLIAANLLSIKAMSSPTCEGYSSLLEVIANKSHKRLLKTAMMSDSTNRDKLQNNHMMKNISEYLSALQKPINNILKNPDLDSWTKLRGVFNGYE